MRRAKRPKPAAMEPGASSFLFNRGAIANLKMSCWPNVVLKLIVNINGCKVELAMILCEKLKFSPTPPNTTRRALQTPPRTQSPRPSHVRRDSGYVTDHPPYLLRLPEEAAKREAYGAFVADLNQAAKIAAPGVANCTELLIRGCVQPVTSCR